jgi:hypothetical protein
MQNFSMKTLVTKIICLIIIVEVIAHQLPINDFYGEMHKVFNSDPVKYIFIGTSRVGCSINPSVFSQSVCAGDRQDVSINMGRGYSTLVEHLFGVRDVARNYPDKFKGVVVFLEAPQGVPNTENWSWQQSWVHPDAPEVLATTMRFNDLGAFWFTSGTDFNSKLIVTASLVSATAKLKGRWKTVLTSLKSLFRSDTPKLAKGPEFLGSEIRTDLQGIKNARKLAQAEVDKEIAGQEPLPADYWDKSVLKSLNEQITSAGGHLVLFYMPLSTVKAKIFSTEIGNKNKEIVSKAMNIADIPVIVPAIKTTDDDFPDFWHLRGSRNVEYTQAVAQAFLGLKKSRGW